MKKYWTNLDEYKNPDNYSAGGEKTFDEQNPIKELLDEELGRKKSSRRNFLKLCGFTVTAAALASSCENPVKKAIPYLNQPEDVVPGKSNYYASSFFDGHDFASIIVKNRDGRPIKIEGNDLSPINAGSTNARTQAAILNLYDGSGRIKNPLKDQVETNWEIIDKEIKEKLIRIQQSGKKLALLSSGIISPSTKKLLEEFRLKYPNTELYEYNPISWDAIRDASMQSFGIEGIPLYDFGKAEIIVGFNADFLGNWLSPVEHARQYADTRRLSHEKKSLSKHYQFETGMSITGSSADIRHPVKPSEEGIIIANLYNHIAKKSGMPAVQVDKSPVDIHKPADELLKNKGKSLVVSGSNNLNIQLLINAINYMLGNYEKTLFLSKRNYVKAHTKGDLTDLRDGINKGEIKGLFLHQVNPFYDAESTKDIENAFEKLDLTVSFDAAINETTAASYYVCPNHHFLESWDDAMPRTNQYTLVQPLINPIFNTRPFQESLMKWADIDGTYQEYIKKYWKENIFPLQPDFVAFDKFWFDNLKKGVFELKTNSKELFSPAFKSESILQSMGKTFKSAAKDLELCLYESIALGNGIYANNPWLQELPDPVSKVCWDNFAAISPKFAQEEGLENGDIIRINDSLEIPVYIQPGQAYKTLSIAMGYGRTKAGKVGEGIGINGYALTTTSDGYRDFMRAGISITKTSAKTKLALSQVKNSMMDRPIIREATLEEYTSNPAAGNEYHEEAEKHHVSLYKEKEFPGHHWALAVDLNACNGCSTCVVACQAENNIAVVGKDEVRRRRIMHWIRLDRYYSEEPENPEVSFQPMLCQHCDNAPCENVCPVAATLHSDEGINQMAYNRCVGTKYCINNCPYKVRRFNWFRYVTNNAFDYNMNEDLGRMVLNPDVTVRERGVVEKCSFCIQRIQEKKMQAKLENRPLEDGEIMPACVQACPSKALVFGDLNNPKSKVSKLFKDERNYHVLEQLHTLPSIGYLTKIRNKPAEEKTHNDHS